MKAIEFGSADAPPPRMMTLLSADLILTGVPARIGPLASGDSVEVEVEKVGVSQKLVSV
jgi:2-keto-4-pentenoate hydratase/2-oxohepta-3-ene-1,7-dioic acid hydratase in catechol pathway